MATIYAHASRSGWWYALRSTGDAQRTRIGDLIRAGGATRYPSLRALREAHPGAHVVRVGAAHLSAARAAHR